VLSLDYRHLQIVMYGGLVGLFVAVLASLSVLRSSFTVRAPCVRASMSGSIRLCTASVRHISGLRLSCCRMVAYRVREVQLCDSVCHPHPTVLSVIQIKLGHTI